MRAGVVGEGRAPGSLSGGEQVAVGVNGVAEVLEVLHVHRLGQLDRVVVAEHAFDRHRELVIVAGHVRVDEVEPVEECPVVRHLLDVLVRHVDVRDVVGPPLVVLLEVGAQRLIGRVLAIALVLLGGLREFLRGRAELELEGDRFAGLEADAADQVVALGLEAVTAEARRQGRHLVAGCDLAGPLRAVGCRGGGGGRGRGDGPAGRRRNGVGERQQCHGHVVVGDELGLVGAEAGRVVDAGPVARVLSAVGRRLGEGRAGDADCVEVLVCAGRPFAVRPAAAEAQGPSVVGVHVQRPAAGIQEVASAAAGGALEHAVDPERLAAGGNIGVEDGLQHARVAGSNDTGSSGTGLFSPA